MFSLPKKKEIRVGGRTTEVIADSAIPSLT